MDLKKEPHHVNDKSLTLAVIFAIALLLVVSLGTLIYFLVVSVP